MSHNNGRIVAPGRGKCVSCDNPAPCFAHTPIVFKGKDGKDQVYNNVIEVLAAIIAELSALRRTVDSRITVVSE